MKIKNSLGYLLGTSTRLMKRRMDFNLNEYGVTTSQWAILKLLSEKKQLTQKQIADELCSDKTTVGEIIKLLYEKNYIEKTTNDLDKRAFNINLTTKAKDIIDEIERKGIDVIEGALQGLDVEQIELLYKILHQIIVNLCDEVIE